MYIPFLHNTRHMYSQDPRSLPAVASFPPSFLPRLIQAVPSYLGRGPRAPSASVSSTLSTGEIMIMMHADERLGVVTLTLNC